MTDNNATENKSKIIEMLRSPVRWGEHNLTNRDGTPRRYWEHQKEDLECKDRNIIHLDGRKVGKTEVIVTDVLHYAFTTRGGSGLVGAAFQGHIETIISSIE